MNRFFSYLFTLVLLPSLLLAAYTADLSKGQVSIQLSAEPERIDPAHELMLTFTVDAPENLKVTFPDLQDRFSGFSLAEDFATEPIVANGQIRQVFRWRLIPKPGEERYRLAPFAVTTLDTSKEPNVMDSFATIPVVFPKEGERPVVTGDPEVTLEPEWIAPTAKTITIWVFLVVLALAIVAGIIWGLTKITVHVKEMRMSPIQRAMIELQRLLNRNLTQHGRYKDFYVELTQVVRRYIERRHGIHAPEQTTEEFLSEATKHKAFTTEVIASLRTFLESADLVKFAGQEATDTMANEATDRARAYLKQDSEATDAAEQQADTTPKDTL